MRITQGIPNLYIRNNYSEKSKLSVVSDNPINKSVGYYSYPAVYFSGKIAPPKEVSIKFSRNSQKNFLLKKIDDILQNDVSEREMTKEELQQIQLERTTSFMLAKEAKLRKLDNQILMLWQKIRTHAANPQALLDERNALSKEVKRIEKSKLPKFELPKPKAKDEQTDFALINKFKSAVSEDNFDLKRVFKEHYSGLNEAKTVKDVAQKYPKINIPKNPKDVVAQRIVSTLTRDFYEQLDSVYETSGKKEARRFIKQGVENILDEQLKKVPPDKRKMYKKKLVTPAVSAIAQSYKKEKDADSIHSIPVARKVNKVLISDLDKKLLSVDYDNFVISTLKEQYIGLKKPNDISYREGDITINISELKNSEYKFPRIPIKTKCLLDEGAKAKSIQRDYDNFTRDDFVERLEFQADRLDANESYLDKFVSFSTCEFTPEDISMLKLFLKEGDKVLDGEKTAKEAIRDIHYNNIRPSGTERMNEMERRSRLEKIRDEQKKHNELVRIQTEYDNSVNLLYQNDMAYIAEICSPYRPTSRDVMQKQKADYISKVIADHTDEKNPNKLLNKDRLASKITRWNKYNEYKNKGTDSEVLIKAEQYAKDKSGNIDYDKAGKYIINSEAVATYPESFKYAHNREAAEKIMENCGDDKNKAVEYLCKYDDYIDLSQREKSKISNIVKIFDKKDYTEKQLLKLVVENEYVKTPTTEWSKMDETGSKKVKATIAPSAKQGVLDYYMFPKCLEFFDAFENALPQFATTWSSPGIKKVDKNIYELKILDKTDRLIARNNVYYFDEFSEIGFH